jgi:hypothetical protein
LATNPRSVATRPVSRANGVLLKTAGQTQKKPPDKSGPEGRHPASLGEAKFPGRERGRRALQSPPPELSNSANIWRAGFLHRCFRSAAAIMALKPGDPRAIVNGDRLRVACPDGRIVVRLLRWPAALLGRLSLRSRGQPGSPASGAAGQKCAAAHSPPNGTVAEWQKWNTRNELPQRRDVGVIGTWLHPHVTVPCCAGPLNGEILNAHEQQVSHERQPDPLQLLRWAVRSSRWFR